VLTWTGAHFSNAARRASAQGYEYAQCTERGRYTIDVCGYRNPNPEEWSDGCLEAGAQAAATTTSTTFDYSTSTPMLLTILIN